MEPHILTAEEIKTIVREAVRAELYSAGLRLEDQDHIDDARRDFTFLRKLRSGVDGAAGKVGSAVIMAVFSGVLVLIGVGAGWFKQ